jgi:hypothetical protein
MNRLYLLACLIVGALALEGARAQSSNPGKLPPRPAKLALDDQFERSHDLTEHAGDVVILLYGDRQGMPANKDLGENLHIHYHPAAKNQPPSQARKAPVTPLPNLPDRKRSPDVKVVPVACFGHVSAVIRGVIRNQVKKNAPETPVWLDFEDKMKEQFGLTAGVPNLVILDIQGRLRHHAAGELDAKSVAQIIEAIDVLRREAVGLAR